MAEAGWKGKLIVLFLGVFVALTLLEVGLRIGGAVFLWQQERRNTRALEAEQQYLERRSDGQTAASQRLPPPGSESGAEGGVVARPPLSNQEEALRILCVGESTTAMGGSDSYPSQLEHILNERAGGRRFTVINKGIPGGTSSSILEALAANLTEYRPDIVVAMMGANDGGRGAVPLAEELERCVFGSESSSSECGSAPGMSVSREGKGGFGGLRSLKIYKLTNLALYYLGRRSSPSVAVSWTATAPGGPPPPGGVEGGAGGPPGASAPPAGPGSAPGVLGPPGGGGRPGPPGPPGPVSSAGPAMPGASGFGAPAVGAIDPRQAAAPGNPGGASPPSGPVPMHDFDRRCSRLRFLQGAWPPPGPAGPATRHPPAVPGQPPPMSGETSATPPEVNRCEVIDTLLEQVFRARYGASIPLRPDLPSDMLREMSTSLNPPYSGPTFATAGMFLMAVNEFERVGRTDEFKALLRAALERFPTSGRFHLDIALLIGLKGGPPEIDVMLLEKAIELDPGLTGAYVVLARTYESQEKYQEAHAVLERALFSGLDSFDVLLALANSHQRRGDRTRAAELFEEAVTKNPASELSYLELGKFLEQDGRLQEAEGMYRKVLELNPRETDTFRRLGKVLEAQGKTGPAEEAYRRAVNVSHQCSAYEGLVTFYERRGAHEKIQTLFAEIGPEVAQQQGNCLIDLIGKYYLRQGRKELADAYYNRFQYYSPMTRVNYRRMKEKLDARGIRLVSVQYPVRSLLPLELLLAGIEGIVFVDNERSFKEALQKHEFRELFWDDIYGDFGHGTRKGNRLLAENVANVILTQVVPALSSRPAAAHGQHRPLP